MPYALQPPLEDGEKVGGSVPYRSAEEVPEGWVFVDADEDAPLPGVRYDAAAGKPRLPTQAEELEEMRGEKKVESTVEGRSKIDDLLTDGFERDELLMKLCASFVQLAQETGNPKALDPCILEVARQGKAVQDLHDRLDAIDLDADPEAERKIRGEGLR